MKRDAISWAEAGAPDRDPCRARATARAATLALHDELALYPKPGLVSYRDTGSHTDMDAAVFLRSLSCLRHYFRAVTLAGARGAPFAELQALGIAAEQRMLERTRGINTHRGAIFTLGLLCAAAGAVQATPCAALHPVHSPEARRLQDVLQLRWSTDIAARLHRQRGSNGQRVVQALGLRGIEQEAALGFPTLFEVTAPALRHATAAGLSREAAQLQAFYETLAVLDDTNLAHRGGLPGLRWAQAQARAFLARGGMFQPDALVQAQALHQAFVQRRLSPGGCADLLAAACWLARMGLLP